MPAIFRRPEKAADGAKKKRPERYVDYLLILIILTLLAFGLIVLYSTTSYTATVKQGDPAFYLRKQFLFTVLGLFAMLVAALIPYSIWRYFGPYIYVLSLMLVFLTIPFGSTANGATRWLYFHGISIQPSEIAKLGLIMFGAYLVQRIGRSIRTLPGFIGPLFPAALAAGLLWKITDNLSSAIIVMAIVFGILFVACPDYKRFIALAAAGVAGAAGVVWLIVRNAANTGSTGMGFRGERILAWLDPQAYASGRGYQTLQALYAIGSGGLFGKGLGQSLQKLGHVPELQNDMIFSIICEELGFFGAIAVMLMYLLLIWRCVVIASNADDLYGALLVVGVMTQISVQVILNIAVVTNSIPNTGVSLPFISYGGSSVVILLAEIGIVLSVARGLPRKKQ